jgi:ATP-binding cassette, subfamily C, bacterial CydC
MSVFWRLLRLMRPAAGWMALAVLLATVTALANIALIATSGWFITAMGLAGVAGAAMNYFTPAAMIRGFAILRTAGRYGERIIGHDATLRFVASLRPWFFARLEPLAPAALGDYRSGDLLTQLKTDIDRLELVFLRIVAPLAVAVLTLAPALFWLGWHDPGMGFAVGAFALLAGLGLPLLIRRLGASASRGVSAASADLNARLVDHVEGLAELSIYDLEGHHRAALLATSDTLRNHETRLAGLSAFANGGVGLAASLAFFSVLSIGIPALTAGRLASADLAMLAFFALALFEVIAPLPMALQSLPLALASALRLFETIDRAPPVPDPAHPATIPRAGTLRFDRCGLTYPDNDAPALRDVSLELAPCRPVALVGPSGSGKSSVVALAMRFRASDQGAICFADQPVETFTGDALRDRIALLAQNAHLFSASIDANLRLARPQATAEEIAEACRIAGILSFIQAQPAGFDTFIGAHGLKLSGGERRRLALARTLLKDAPILILDEPTEGLDSATGHAVLDAVLTARAERAVLLITHRPVGLDRMAEVIRLESGRAVARGAPETGARKGSISPLDPL